MILSFIVIFDASYSYSAESEIKNQSETKEERNRPNDLRLRALYSLVNYNLESKGFKTSNTGEMGSGYDFVYRRINEKGIFRILSSSTKSEFETSTGLSPAKIESKLSRSLMDYQLNSGFGFGLEYRERKTEETTPNQTMPNNSKTSLRFFYGSAKSLDENFQFDYEAGLLLPMVHYEKSPRTGSLSHAAAADLEVNLVYKVNHFIDAALGVQLLYENNRFVGSGNRGTVAADETFIHTNFPIELRFRF